ncbi:MAG: hypothetical protein AB1403_12980, partial [Candidatus Riflebacteria bacterium]
MSDSIKHVLETDFATALDCIESPDPETRRSGAARLEKIGGNRSYQVASVLVGDADPIVASIARRICSTQRKAGLVWRGPQAVVRPAERQLISNAWQILDEVVFIARRNMGELALTSLLAALPKLFLIFTLFAGPYLIKGFFEYLQTVYIVAAIFLNQVLWRPLAWTGIGKAFLVGYPDRLTRQYAKSINIWRLYLPMLAAHLINALFFSAALSYSMKAVFSRVDEFELLMVWFCYWLFIWEMFYFLKPMLLLRGTAGSIFQGLRMRFGLKNSIALTNVFFIFICGFIYLMI